MSDIKISLGCGKHEREGFVGLDIEDFGWNKVWDATTDPIPFGDSSVDFIEAHNFLEHIERKHWPRLFNECHRVLKPGGVLEMIVPNAARSLDLALSDITHVSLFVPGMLRYLRGDRPRNADYGLKHWHIIEQRDEPQDERAFFFQLKPKK